MTTGAEWLERIRALPLPPSIKVMNVCGGHERSITTAGQVRRPDIRNSRLAGAPWASSAAAGAVVVSKPAARNTTLRSGFSNASFAASSGLAIGRTSAPAAFACSSERGSLFGALTGTRSMSPYATRMTFSCSASWIAS